MKQLYLLIISICLHATLYAQTSGCTDPLANNYNANTTNNDGSCLYDPVIIAPTSSFDLDSMIKETSGLIFWQNKLWTQNDDADNKIYALDTLNGNILYSVGLNGLVNIDWEEISQDDSFIYVGDFGNNVSGNRTNLRIYKLAKQSILDNNILIETIAFNYADQVDFSPQTANHTDFDCEAFVATADSIYLFTKQWISNKTTIYVLPKTAGMQIAQNRGTLDVAGLITGSVLMKSKQLIALSGYTAQLQPFVYLLYDFPETNFFGGNKRKLQLNLPFHQVEGITTNNGLKYYITNEAFSYSPIFVTQQMHILDLQDYLSNFLNSNNTGFDVKKKNKKLTIFPNPAFDKVTVFNVGNEKIIMRNIMGKILNVPIQENGETTILDLSKIHQGIYMVGFKGNLSETYTLLIKK